MFRKRLPLRAHVIWWSLCAMVVCSLFPSSLLAQVGTTPETTGQVIAQGIDTLTRGDVSWRVLTSEARAANDAEFGERYRGFAYATEDPIVVSTLATGQSVFLSPGQAHFSPVGVTERRSAEGTRAAEYLNIQLVPDGTDSESSIEFEGAPFRSPRGDYNLQLTRAVALPAESATFTPENDLPYLLLVIDGAVQTTTDDGAIAELGAGDAVEHTGALEVLSGANDGATWLIASIGNEVAVPPFPTAVPGSTGTLVIELEQCPDGFDNACEPATNDDVTVPAFHHADDENWIIPDKAEWSDDGSTYTYANLPSGQYTTGPEDDPADNVNLEGARWSNESEGWEFRIRDNRTTTLQLQVVPESTSDTGSIQVTLYDCPEGTDPETDARDCDTSQDPWNIPFNPAGADSMDDFLTLLDDARDLGDGQFAFDDLPAGTWEFSPDEDGPDGPIGMYVTGDAYVLDGVPGMYGTEVEPGETASIELYRVVSSQSTGSLFVSLYDCPAGTDPSDDASACDLAAEPWDVGVAYIGQSDTTEWSLVNDAIDMGDGTWWFELMPATTLTLYPGGFEPSGDAVIWVGGDAESAGDDTWSVVIPGGGAADVVLFRVAAGNDGPDEPVGGSGSLVITQFDCPNGTDIDVDSSPCLLSDAPWEVTVTNVDTGESWNMTTDGVAYDSGTYVFESLPAGTYAIAPAANDNWDLYYWSTVDVSADDETYVTIYSVDRREG